MTIVEATARRPTNVSLDRALVDEAKAMGINLSQACERGIANQVAKVRAERWLAENKAAISAYNDYFEEHGLPLTRFRQF